MAGADGVLGETAPVRIGTWNLEGRWDDRHLDLITRMDCDVLLLTEVSERVHLAEYEMHLGDQLMARQRRWAAVATRQLPLRPLPAPHGASAMVELEGLRVCSSILPWRGCGTRGPWTGSTTSEKTSAAVAEIEAHAPSVWGGDWNHALSGREWTGSIDGRRTLLAAVERLQLQVPTAEMPHQIDGLVSIDHLAVPTTWEVRATQRYRAFVGAARISDHDAYVVDAVPSGACR
jgi:endonuclease/exonuclease/phosphatase family metal-dependent hydrolase